MPGMPFQSSPHPRARCNVIAGIATRVSTCFNPHRTREHGATHPDRLVCSCGLFQSSPHPRARCNSCGASRQRCTSGFNPHRTREHGATVQPTCRQISVTSVSILTAPESTVQPHCCSATAPTVLVFQSSPHPRARCNCGIDVRGSRRPRFQSSPHPRARCNHRAHVVLIAQTVSILTAPESTVQLDAQLAIAHRGSRFQILTAPESTVQPAACRWHSRSPACFNPHRTREHGATPDAERQRRRNRFQSSPHPRARCNRHQRCTLQIASSGFNPHRTREHGATRARARRCVDELVSILTAPESTVQLPRRQRHVPAMPGFNPHRTREHGATRQHA